MSGGDRGLQLSTFNLNLFDTLACLVLALVTSKLCFKGKQDNRVWA